MGTTKNSVIGKLVRCGVKISELRRKHKVGKSDDYILTRKVNQLRRLGREMRESPDATLPPVVPEAFVEEQGGPGVGLLDLEPHHCRWPLWQAGEAPSLYCGVKRETGSSYCAEHKFIARNGSPPTGKRFVMRRQKAA